MGTKELPELTTSICAGPYFKLNLASHPNLQYHQDKLNCNLKSFLHFKEKKSLPHSFSAVLLLVLVTSYLNEQAFDLNGVDCYTNKGR